YIHSDTGDRQEGGEAQRQSEVVAETTVAPDQPDAEANTESDVQRTDCTHRAQHRSKVDADCLAGHDRPSASRAISASDTARSRMPPSGAGSAARRAANARRSVASGPPPGASRPGGVATLRAVRNPSVEMESELRRRRCSRR